MRKALNFLIILLIITLLGGVFWFVYTPDKYNISDIDNLVEQNFKVYPNEYTSSLKFTDSTSLALTAMKFYTLGNYKMAMETFQKYEPEPKDDGYYNLYLGICYYKIGYNSIAVGHFEESMSSFKMFNDKCVAKWYLSLGLLKSNRVKEAKVLLKELVNQNTLYEKKAKELLKAL